MLNAFAAELMKAKKNKIFVVGTMTVVLVPILIILKDLFLVPPPREYTDWMISGCMLNGAILPLMSGFIITFLIQREYQEQTIINVLTAPVPRKNFILSKLLVWFLWYVIILFAVVAIYVAGYYVIYPDVFHGDGIQLFIKYFAKNGLFSFIASFPLLWVAIKQKKMFYPAILATIGFDVIQLAGINISIGTLPFASAIPWSAVSIVSMFEVQAQYKVVCMVSILMSGILGLLCSIVAFKKQDQ